MAPKPTVPTRDPFLSAFSPLSEPQSSLLIPSLLLCWPLLPPLILIGSTQPPFSHNKRKKKKPKSPENLGKAIFPPLSLLHRPREEEMTKRDGVPFLSLALLSNHVGHFPLKDIFWLGPAVASEKNKSTRSKE